MERSSITATQRSAAKVSGLVYLFLIIAGILAEFVLRQSLIVAGNATETAENILASESVFRSSMALDLAMIGADMVVAVALYVLLRPINRHLALLAAFFRVVMDSILGVNLLNLVVALTLFRGDTGISGFDSDQMNALGMTFIEAHAVGYSIGLVPFGLATLIISYLLYSSNIAPRIVAGMLALAGLTYLAGSTIHILWPTFEATFSVAYVVPLVAETTLALWLVFGFARIQIRERSPIPAVSV